MTTRHVLFEPDPDSDDDDGPESGVGSDRRDSAYARHYRPHVHGHGTVPDAAPITGPPPARATTGDSCEISGDPRQRQPPRRSSVGAQVASPRPSPSPPKRRQSKDIISVGALSSAVAPRPPSYKSRPRRWQLAYVVRILPRRYLLQRCALELFFVDHSSVFVAFATSRLRAVWDAIWAQHPPRLSDAVKSLKPADHFKAWGVQERWRRRELSNFDYLMALNLCAGRRCVVSPNQCSLSAPRFHASHFFCSASTI